MGWLSKDAKLPSELATAIPKNDRLLAWATYRGGLLAVTDKNLVCIDNLEPTLISWTIALQARWEPPMLTLVTQPDSQTVATSQTWELDLPGKVPSALRDRVTSAVIVDRAYDLPNAGRVRFVARRDGQNVTWIAVADDLAAPQSVEGANDVANALTELKSIFGI